VHEVVERILILELRSASFYFAPTRVGLRIHRLLAKQPAGVGYP
jgi:hypothetical protein